jgi:hypothetical protein
MLLRIIFPVIFFIIIIIIIIFFFFLLLLLLLLFTAFKSYVKNLCCVVETHNFQHMTILFSFSQHGI